MAGSDDSRSDEELVEAMNSGDVAAFEALYRRYRDWVVRLAMRFTGHPDDALDALQETFAYFLGKFPGFELRAKMTTFFYPVVRNVSVRLREKGRRFATSEEALAAAAAAAAGGPGTGEDPRAEIAALVRDLSELHREVILLRYVDEMSLEEIAGALGVPLGTVKSRLHHAIAALRDDPRVREYFRP